MINSRNKGAAYEREIANLLKEYGFDEARRGQQYSGGSDSPDVVGLPGFHVECKRRKTSAFYAWMDQAERDRAPGRVPLIIHRADRRKDVAILPLKALLDILVRLSNLEQWSDVDANAS